MPDLSRELVNAIVDADAAHGEMSRQALDSEKLRADMLAVLLEPGKLYEALRERGAAK
jgi:type I restriction enzyme, R subunit